VSSNPVPGEVYSIQHYALKKNEWKISLSNRYLFLFRRNHIGGVMISVLASITVDRGFNLWQKVSTYDNYGQCCVISLYRSHSCSKIELFYLIFLDISRHVLKIRECYSLPIWKCKLFLLSAVKKQFDLTTRMGTIEANNHLVYQACVSYFFSCCKIKHLSSRVLH
jgi:hypothetical protein